MNAPERSRLYAAGLTAAIAVGVVLGNSTIASINPAHFASSAIRPAEGIIRDAPEPTPLYAAQYSPEQAMLIRAAVCPGCDAASSGPAFYSTAVPYFGSREERATVEARERRAIDDSYALRERRREERRALGMGGPFEPATGVSEQAETIGRSEPDPEASRDDD